MWWEPQTEQQSHVQRTIDRLGDYLTGGRAGSSSVYGVGFTVSHRDELVPLLVVDHGLDPRRGRIVGAEDGGVFARWLLDRFGRPRIGIEWVRDDHQPGVPLRLGRRPWRLGRPDPLTMFSLMLLPFAVAGSRIQERLGEWEVPWSTSIMFSPPLLPLAGSLVKSGASRDRASLGFHATLPGGRAGFTTAGHLVSDTSSPVRIISRRFGIFESIVETGTVVAHSDPLVREGSTEAGYDITVAESSDHPSPRPSHSRRLAYPSDVALQKEVATLQGGVSGLRQGYVMAGLDCGEQKNYEGVAIRRWANCWFVSGQGGWACKKRDSGAPVLIKDGLVLGQLVAGQGWPSSSGRYEIGIVQDMQSQLSYLAEMGISLLLE